jgi:hypothetical protein
MRPVPLWRFAPFRAPAAIDVNLCTDSVLPRSVAPGLGYAASGFCGHFSPAFLEISIHGVPNGAVPCPYTAQFLILTGLITLLAGYALTSRVSSRVCGGNSSAESLGDHRRRPIPSTLFRWISQDFCKDFFVPPASLLFKALSGRCERLPWFRNPRALSTSS